MRSRKLLRKIIITTSVVIAMIGALSKPASADFLSKKDKITIGEKRKNDSDWYKIFEADTDSLFAKLKKQSSELNKLKGRKISDINSTYAAIDSLYSGLYTLHSEIWTEFSIIAENNHLGFGEVFRTMKKLHDSYIETILAYSDETVKFLEKKESLDENDISMIKILIDILDRLHNGYAASDVPLLNGLKALLAKQIDKKFP